MRWLSRRREVRQAAADAALASLWEQALPYLNECPKNLGIARAWDRSRDTASWPWFAPDSKPRIMSNSAVLVAVSTRRGTWPLSPNVLFPRPALAAPPSL
jgi:hypothetical protein